MKKNMFFSIGNRRKRLTDLQLSSDEEFPASSYDENDDPYYIPPIEDVIKKPQKNIHDVQKVACSSVGTIDVIAEINDNDKWNGHRNNLKEILIFSNATPIRSSVSYKCCYCKTNFAEAADLKKHSTAHNVEAMVSFAARVHNHDGRITCVILDVTSLRCALCPAKNLTLDHLAEHLNKVHNKNTFSDSLNLILPFEFPPDANNFQCIKCTRKYITFNALLQHMNEHYQNFVCDICGAGFANEISLPVHSEMHDTGRFKCIYCPDIFKFERNRANHELKLHNNAKERTCKDCNKVFGTRYKKRIHNMKVHGVKAKVTSVPCCACGKQYNSSWELNKHIRSEHLLERNHKCELCDKAFLLKCGLQKLMLVHSDSDSDFACGDCDKRFETKCAMEVHRRSHTNEKPFKCGICGQGFTREVGLKRHMWSKHRTR